MQDNFVEINPVAANNRNIRNGEDVWVKTPTGAKLKVTTPGGKPTFENIPAGAIFFGPTEIHSAEIIGGLGTRSYIIELKGKDWKPSTG